eukprot:gene1840-3075_t
MLWGLENKFQLTLRAGGYTAKEQEEANHKKKPVAEQNAEKIAELSVEMEELNERRVNAENELQRKKDQRDVLSTDVEPFDGQFTEFCTAATKLFGENIDSERAQQLLDRDSALYETADTYLRWSVHFV